MWSFVVRLLRSTNSPTQLHHRNVDDIRRSSSHRCQSQIVVEHPDFCPAHLHSTPALGGLCWNVAITFGTEKLEWCGQPTVKNFESIFIRFDRILERTWLADRHRVTAWEAALMHSIARQNPQISHTCVSRARNRQWSRLSAYSRHYDGNKPRVSFCLRGFSLVVHAHGRVTDYYWEETTKRNS